MVRSEAFQRRKRHRALGKAYLRYLTKDRLAYVRQVIIR